MSVVPVVDLHWWMLPLTAWLVFVAVHDLHTWRVPAWATWPVITVACLYQARAGAWAPLGLWALLFLWDTSRGDLLRLLRREITEESKVRPLLPDWLAWAGHALLLALASAQPPAALPFTLGIAIAHTLWRMNRLPGGDAALLIALFGIFPDARFYSVTVLTVGVLVAIQLSARYSPDLVIAGRLCLACGPAPAAGVLAAAVRAKARPGPVAYMFSLAGLAAMLLL